MDAIEEYGKRKEEQGRKTGIEIGIRERKAIILLYNEGVEANEIAEILNLEKELVERILKTRKTVRFLYKKGIKINEIAEILDLCEEYVEKMLKEVNLI